MMSVTNITLAADEPIVSFSSDFLRKMSALVTSKLKTLEGKRSVEQLDKSSKHSTFICPTRSISPYCSERGTVISLLEF